MDLRGLHINGDPLRLKVFFEALNEARWIVASSFIGGEEEYEVQENAPEQENVKPAEEPAEEQKAE